MAERARRRKRRITRTTRPGRRVGGREKWLLSLGVPEPHQRRTWPTQGVGESPRPSQYKKRQCKTLGQDGGLLEAPAGVGDEDVHVIDSKSTSKRTETKRIRKRQIYLLEWPSCLPYEPLDEAPRGRWRESSYQKRLDSGQRLQG